MATLFEMMEIDETEYEGLLAEMDPVYAAEMLSLMYADDAADVKRNRFRTTGSYLTIMNDESARELKELLSYEEYTAGSIMTTKFVAIEVTKPFVKR